MANTNKVEVEIVAKDEATPKIAKLEKRIDGLESDEARIIVTAETDKLEQQLTDARRKMEALEGDELTVQMRAVGSLEEDLQQAQKLVEQLDGKTGTVRITADTQGLDTSLSKADTGLKQVEASADSSKSVLANMVGNATQDLGALGGVAGSAGVAIGQMGEYMADAKAKGEGFGSILKSFSTVVGPIAAISVGVGLATKAWSDYKAKQKEVQEAIKDTIKGLAETLNLVDDFPEKFDEATSAYEAFADILLGNEDAQAKTLGFLADLKLTLDDLPRVISAISSSDPQAIADLIKELGGSDEAAAAVAELVGEGERLSTLNSNATLLPWVKSFGEESANAILALSGLADEINGLQPNEAASKFLDRIAVSSPAARDAIAALRAEMPNADNVAILEAYLAALDGIAMATDQWAAANRDVDSMVKSMPKTWEIVTRAVGKLTQGQKASAEEQEAINTLVNTFGIDASRVLDIARGLWDQHGATIDRTKIRYNQLADAAGDELAAAARRGIETGEKLLKGMETDALDAKLALSGINSELRDIAENQDELESDSLAKALDLGDAPLDALTNIRNIDQGIRDLAEWVRTNGIPNIFDKDDVNADDFLNEIARLKGPIQEAIADAFAEGGTGAATALSQKFISQLASQSGLTSTQVSTLLGLDSLEASIDVAINETSLAQAKAQLDLLVGVQGGYTPYTASIALALQAEEITPENAQILVQEALRGEGVTIPSELAVPLFDNALRRAQNDLNSHPVTIPLRLGNIPQSELNRITGMLSGSTPLNSQPRTGTVNQTIIMPQSTPSQTYDSFQIFTSRNGVRDVPQ